ncbi:Flagellar basal-body rod protein FlgC [hydrothermal vent metagenome]|uniref:Flagellar basal-body rod protein FlgC n=1 Tax=hydrothermal vent metagenome TaxID=652676 RepID=A0A3B0TW79_9ZZZZ
MEFIKSIMIAATGLKAQTGRMRVIAENLANANSVSQTPGGEPYRRRIPVMQASFSRELDALIVKTGKPIADKSEFKLRYMPGHPAANEDGYVSTPNVNSLIESMDMRAAQRTYEANLNVITSARRMVQRTIDILRA